MNTSHIQIWIRIIDKILLTIRNVYFRLSFSFYFSSLFFLLASLCWSCFFSSFFLLRSCFIFICRRVSIFICLLPLYMDGVCLFSSIEIDASSIRPQLCLACSAQYLSEIHGLSAIDNHEWGTQSSYVSCCRHFVSGILLSVGVRVTKNHSMGKIYMYIHIRHLSIRYRPHKRVPSSLCVSRANASAFPGRRIFH